MKSLKDYSEDDLLQELKRREEFGPKPQVVEEPDFSVIIKLCKQYIDDIENDEKDDDYAHYIYEAALEAVFGKDIWDYINK